MINLKKEDIPNYVGPKPIAVQEDGKKCFEIKSIKHNCIYKLWAFTYKEAVDMLPMVENA
jgi:hypothetical protein